jgi:MFS family permease
MIGGILADYLGRKRTTMLAILAYSIVTGLSAFAWDWMSFAVLRFLVGVAIGSEWVTGASIVSELWPTARSGARAASARPRELATTASNTAPHFGQLIGA